MAYKPWYKKGTYYYWKEGERPEGWEGNEDFMSFMVLDAALGMSFEDSQDLDVFLSKVLAGEEIQLPHQFLGASEVKVKAGVKGVRVCMDKGDFIRLAHECYCKGEDAVYGQIDLAAKRGIIAEGKHFQDALRGLREAASMVRESRDRSKLRGGDEKQFKKQISEEEVMRAVRETPRRKNGKLNLSAIGRKLDLKDTKTVIRYLGRSHNAIT